MDQRISRMIAEAEDELGLLFEEIDRNEEERTRQVLAAFREEGVSYRHFAGTTGYGYDDIGRDTLERIYARIFHTEAGLMRPHIASGTAALSLTLFG
ncbi:MAG: methionine gamma-lyase family protein, partial [Clostridia bacterium]